MESSIISHIILYSANFQIYILREFWYRRRKKAEKRSRKEAENGNWSKFCVTRIWNNEWTWRNGILKTLWRIQKQNWKRIEKEFEEFRRSRKNQRIQWSKRIDIKLIYLTLTHSCPTSMSHIFKSHHEFHYRQTIHSVSDFFIS